ncbi:urokinase plasminogen activator surface receptor-like [Hyperolius riggenbachi]|uniref:urokinase plasminogen activator surface receptor-like n=1 Tax=Hyperolius riggenbachi TaxID=752182 RepID=UPI0035A2F91F
MEYGMDGYARPAFSLSSSTCVPGAKTVCTGNETRCSTYTITSVSGPKTPLLISGCATKTVCVDSVGVTLTSIIGGVITNVTCQNATDYLASSTTVASTTTTKNHALTCISCSTVSMSLCTGASITCPAGDVCTSTYTKISLLESGITSWTLVRGCGPSTGCNQPVTLSNVYTKVSMNTGCCTTDNCTPGEPAVAAISTVTNGLSCPACVSFTNFRCPSDVTTQCTGTENVCASFSMIINASVTSGPYLLMEGCATENVCDHNSGIVSTIVNGQFSINITCLNATISIPTTRLNCISCSADSQALCSGPSITCPSTADVCISTYTQTQIIELGITSWTLVRGCGQPSVCNQPRYLSNQQLTVNMNTSCCTTNNCYPGEPLGKYLYPDLRPNNAKD